VSRRVVLIGLGVLLLVVTAVFAFGPLRSRDGIATGTVERGDFERWVTADGTLRAASATPVRVPPEHTQPTRNHHRRNQRRPRPGTSQPAPGRRHAITTARTAPTRHHRIAHG
jgi:hypothetical protein